MPRITHPVHIPAGAFGDYSVPDIADLVFLASDVANKEQVPLTGKEMVIVRNVGVSTRNYTINSVPNSFNRTGDITGGIGFLAGAWHCHGPFGIDGWQQSDGNLHFEGTDPDVEWAVIRIP